MLTRNSKGQITGRITSKKVVILVGTLLFIAFLFIKSAKAEYNPPWFQEALQQDWHYCEEDCNYNAGPIIHEPPEIVPERDERIEKIQTYLVNYGSPLKDYVELIISESDKNQIKPELVVAIAIKESSGGKNRCAPFNAWGVMTWTNGKRHCRSFSSWEESIKYEAWLLGEYRKGGRVSVEDIAKRYNPQTPSEWTKGVNNILGKLR